MPIVTVFCPACSQSIESPRAEIEQGVKCPHCQTGFVPHEFFPVLPPAELPAAVVTPTVIKSPARGSAELTHMGAQACLIIGAIVFVFCFLIEVRAEHPNYEFMAWVGWLVMAAFFLELLAQIIFIRAAIEERK